MVKLTPELIEQSCQRTNPLRDREISLRGLHIGVLENLGAARNQFDTIDLTDNELRKLDGFPYMPRIRTVLATNNRITRIADEISANLPSLSTLILTQNNITELGEFEGLKACADLKYLTVLRNPITSKKGYRLFIIFTLPQVIQLLSHYCKPYQVVFLKFI
jgi:U2 small nuclear ribonucleoprotein A'